MLPGEHRLVTKPRITIQLRSPGRIDVLRHIAKDEGDLVLYVDARIGVVTRTTAFGNVHAITGKDEFTVDATVFAEGKRAEISIERYRDGRFSFARDLKIRLLGENTFARIKLERKLKVLA